MIFFVRGKYLSRKINLHIVRVPVKNCRKRKLVWSWLFLFWEYTLVYLLLGLTQLWSGHFMKISWSSWNVHVVQERSLIGFAVRKFRRSWNIWTSNANRAKDIFSSCSVRFTTTLRMSHAKNFAGDKRRTWVEIRIKGRGFQANERP